MDGDGHVHTNDLGEIIVEPPLVCVFVDGGAIADATVLTVLDGDCDEDGVLDLWDVTIDVWGAVQPVVELVLESFVEVVELFDREAIGRGVSRKWEEKTSVSTRDR